MMEDKQNLQLYFKEFVKTDCLSFGGVEKIKKAPDYVCDLFVYEPRNVEEARLGSLFMLGKIENIAKNKYRNLDLLLNLLISVIKREFYSDHRRPTLEALESSLNKANLYLADFAEKGHIEWIGCLHFICGAFSENTLHISQVGRPITKLFRGTTITHIENKFPAPKKPHPLKTFSNIASGTIINGDKIIFATKDVLNIVPLISLKKLAKGNCRQIVEGLKKLSENKIEKSPILCLVLEAKTEAPQEIAACVSTLANQNEPKQPAQLILGIRKIFSLTTFMIKPALKFLLFILLIVGRVFKKLPETRLHKIVRRTMLTGKHISSKIKHLSLILIEQSGIKNKYYNLRSNRPAFFVASVLMVLILILPLAIAQKINYQIKVKDFNDLSVEIQEIQKKTDAALIYSDKEKAKGLIQKNQILFASLLEVLKKYPLKNNEEFIKIASNLQEKYQEQQDSVSNVKRIKNLEEVLNFSTSGFIINPRGIELAKDNLYFYEFESGILYKFNLSANPPADEKNLILTFISAKDELRKMVALDNGQIVLFGQSGKIYLYDSSTNEHEMYSLDPASLIENIVDVKNFLSSFYILDKEQANIIKYVLPGVENIIKGSQWLSKPSEELKNAQSMATDGAVYILDYSETITKYFKGEKIEAIKPVLEKPLAGDNKIFIKTDFKNFYISDPKNKRLIVLDKTGAVINQYINDEFSVLQDFLVTSDEKEVYLLCGKKVYKLAL